MIDWRSYNNSGGAIEPPDSGVWVWLGAATFDGVAVVADDKILVTGATAVMPRVAGDTVHPGIGACYRDRDGLITAGANLYTRLVGTGDREPRDIIAITEVFTGLDGVFEFGVCAHWAVESVPRYWGIHWTHIRFR